jgi:hypothetical protein
MTDSDSDSARWPREMRTPPTDPGLAAEAARNPGGSVAEINGDLVGGDANGYVPAEAIRGAWIVSPEGKLTGEYARNPRHGTPADDFSKLTEMDHFWHWLPDRPEAAVREAVQETLTAQVEGAVLEWMKVTDKPEVVTGAKRSPDDEQHVIVVRTAVAVPFALSVRSPSGRREILWGVFTWAASGLDKPAARHDRTWFDLRADLEWAAERLKERVYEVEQSAKPLLTD